MKPVGTSALSTARLLLRRVQQTDAAYMYKNWTADPRVTRWLTWQAHGSIQVTEKILQLWLSQADNGDCFRWVIVPRALGEPIGMIDVVQIRENCNAACVGYCMGEAWWGNGYMTEALDAVLCYLFEKADFARVEACHCVENPASGRVMKKCGMQYEGTQRQSMRDGTGQLHDVALYAMLRGDRKAEAERA